MIEYVAHFLSDSVVFQCEDDWSEDFIYSSACHSSARYIVEHSDLFNQVLSYLSLDELEEEHLRSLPKNLQAEEIGEYLYDDSNFVTVEE